MRFASATKFSPGDYAPAGRSGAQQLVQAFAAARKNSPDWTGLAQVSMGTRSAERQAAMKAEATVASAGLNALGDVKSTQIKGAYDLAATKEKISGLKAGRMAGRLAGLGGFKIPKKKKFVAPYNDDYLNKLEGKKQQLPGETDVAPSTQGPQLQTADDILPEFNPQSNPSSDSSVQSTGKAPQPVKPQSSGSSGTPTQQQAFNQIYELAKANGGTNFPEVVAAQAMHETGWLSNPNSVYMNSGKTNPFGQTGDRGYGTIPREGFKDGWTIYPDLKTAVGDHIKLWHDTANHPENYNAFTNRDEAIRNVAAAYSPNSDKENIRRGFTVNGYVTGVTGVLNKMGM